MRQARNLKDKLRLQLDRVTHEIIRKLKPKKTEQESRELTNQQIDWVCLTDTVNSGIPDEYGQNANEWFHQRVSRLTEEQMKLYKYKFVEGMSLREIGINMGISKSQADRLLHLMYEVLRREK